MSHKKISDHLDSLWKEYKRQEKIRTLQKELEELKSTGSCLR